MASYYVYSGAGGAGTGADWANAYTTLTAAIAGKAAGDVFYVAHDHSESTAGHIAIQGPALSKFLCVNRAGSVPPVAADLTTGATVATSAAGNLTIAYAHEFFQGIAWHCSGEMFLTPFSARFLNCHFRLTGAGTEHILIQNAVHWRNCTVQFATVGQSIRMTPTHFRWTGTASAITGATIPTYLLEVQNSAAGILLEGVDLSAMVSGKTLFLINGNSGQTILLKDCKLASGVAVNTFVYGTAPHVYGVDLVRSDSTGNYRHERYTGLGTQTVETTIIRTGGASDGMTPISWKLVTSADAAPVLPFESMPISVWNDDTGGTKTVTVEGVWGGGAVPDTNDIWIEVEYLGSASDPQGSFVSSGVTTVLTTPSSYAASSETWGGSTTKFKMSVNTGTIQQKGPITVYVFAALPSSTFYIDPKPTVT